MKKMRLGELLLEEVSDWDDEITSAARFKAFSGQRSDWESRYFFWRDLILRVSRHFGVFSISSSQVMTDWFNRGGLTPLCINDVLMLMYNEGYILQRKDILDPTVGKLTRVVNSAVNLMSKMITSKLILEEELIILPILKDKAEEVVKCLSEIHWNSCVITMEEFRNACGKCHDTSVVLSYLWMNGKAHYLKNKNRELIEGVKICLSPAATGTVTAFDHDMLHLIWVKQKLQKQIDGIDRHYVILRGVALSALKSKSKKKAIEYIGRMKLSGQNREKCVLLLNKIELVINTIRSTETTKEVFEGMKICARFMKKAAVEPEEIRLCLEEIKESMETQEQIHEVLEPSGLCSEVDYKDIEEEFKKMEEELLNQSPTVCQYSVEDKSSMEQLSKRLSSLSVRPTEDAGAINLEPEEE